VHVHAHTSISITLILFLFKLKVENPSSALKKYSHGFVYLSSTCQEFF
jgi:hypothetical protein